MKHNIFQLTHLLEYFFSFYNRYLRFRNNRKVGEYHGVVEPGRWGWAVELQLGPNWSHYTRTTHWALQAAISQPWASERGQSGVFTPSGFWNITFSNEIFSNKLIFLLSRGFNNILPVLSPPWKKSFRRTCSQHNKTQLKIYFTCVELKHIVQSAFWAQTTEDVDELLESASGVSSSSGWNVALRLDLGTAETYSF